MKTVFVLELLGEISNTSSSHIIEVGGISFSRKSLEVLQERKEQELSEILGDVLDDECTYLNTDYTSRPEWVISEYPVTE